MFCKNEHEIIVVSKRFGIFRPGRVVRGGLRKRGSPCAHIQSFLKMLGNMRCTVVPSLVSEPAKATGQVVRITGKLIRPVLEIEDLIPPGIATVDLMNMLF